MNDFDERYISDDAPEQPSLPDAYEAGQQAKIDCMQVRSDGANERALSILNHKNVMVDKMQAEIDELQAKAQMCRDEKTYAISRWSALCKERDELQGRINEALKSADINFWNSSTVKDMVDILKGNKER